MILYLLRHGDALPASGPSMLDADRVLSPEGISDIARLGQFLARQAPDIGRILTSPLARARQTGDLVAQALPSRPQGVATAHLAPGFRHSGLLRELKSDGSSHVLAVGHQPDVASFLSYLIAGTSVHLEMKPGAVAAVLLNDADDFHTGRLLWLLSPAVVKHAVPQSSEEAP